MTTNSKMLEAIPTLKEKEGEALLTAIAAIDPKFYFKDWTVEQLIDGGVRLEATMTEWAKSYTGSNDFVRDVASRLGRKSITRRQTRAVLNVCMKERREAGTTTASTAAPVEPVAPVLPYECYTCSDRFPDWASLSLHKASAHPRTYDCRACEFKTTDQAAFSAHRKEHFKPLFEDVPQSGMDLEALIPTGRYAAPDLDGGSQDYIFLTVRRVPKAHNRTKKFRFGWKSYGEERVEAGTLEIRRWRGDTKELVGEQRPGETYRGAHLREFSLIVRDPTASAKLFGMLMECCGRCGKSLTDPESRDRGIGPECIKHFSCRGGITQVDSHETPETLRARLEELGRDGSTAPAWATAGAAPKAQPIESF